MAQSASANKGSRSRSTLGNVSFSQLKKLLDSRNDREILDGMRKVISVGDQNGLIYTYVPVVQRHTSLT